MNSDNDMYTIQETDEKILQVMPAPQRGRELTEDVKAAMINAATDILHNSYAPYSHYNVAAAVLMSSGKIYTGVNIESSLLSNTICAERNAIFHAAAQGERRIVSIAIVGGMNTDDAEELAKKDYCTPCGVCRQVMRDFADPDEMTIISAKSPSDYREWTLGQLLPESFGPETLKED